MDKEWVKKFWMKTRTHMEQCFRRTLEGRGIEERSRDQASKTAYRLALAAFDDLLPASPAILRQIGKGHEDIIQELLDLPPKPDKSKKWLGANASEDEGEDENPDQGKKKGLAPKGKARVIPTRPADSEAHHHKVVLQSIKPFKPLTCYRNLVSYVKREITFEELQGDEEACEVIRQHGIQPAITTKDLSQIMIRAIPIMEVVPQP